MTEFGHRMCTTNASLHKKVWCTEVVGEPMKQTEATCGQTFLAVTLKQTVPKPCYES
jgi:hypothetical protein